MLISSFYNQVIDVDKLPYYLVDLFNRHSFVDGALSGVKQDTRSLHLAISLNGPAVIVSHFLTNIDVCESESTVFQILLNPGRDRDTFWQAKVGSSPKPAQPISKFVS